MNENNAIYQCRAEASQAARHDVRRGICDDILNGQHTPGTRLAQRDLAKRFGVAQVVVREALLELQAQTPGLFFISSKPFVSLDCTPGVY